MLANYFFMLGLIFSATETFPDVKALVINEEKEKQILFASNQVGNYSNGILISLCEVFQNFSV